MKCQVGERHSWPTMKLVKCQVGKKQIGHAASQLNIRWQCIMLAKWQVGKMASWQNGKLAKWKVGEMAGW